MPVEDIRIEVEGQLELRKALRQAGDDLPKELTAIHKKLTDMVLKIALPNVPVLTGALRASVKGLASQRAAKVKAGGIKKVPYAAAIHWGEGAGNVGWTQAAQANGRNRNIKGRPFLFNAMQQVRPQIEEEYLKSVDQLIKEAMRVVR